MMSGFGDLCLKGPSSIDVSQYCCANGDFFDHG